MTETQINTTVIDLQQHFSTLDKIDRHADAKGHIRKAIGILLGTIFFIGLMQTDTMSMVKLKAIVSILISIAWIIYLLGYLWYFIQRIRKKLIVKQLITESLKNEEKRFLSFDADRVVIKSETQKQEFNWSYFTAYYFTDNSIILFPVGNIYSALAFTESEIGKQSIEELKKIAEIKLEKLIIKST